MLSAKHQRFADEYLKDRNASAAYQRAGYKATGNSAETAASRLLREPEVQAYIEEREAALRKRLEIEQDDIVNLLWDVAQADANELIQHRRLCCRYCYGVGFGYQRTAGERDRDFRAWEKERRKAEREAAAEGKELPAAVFDEQGGVGYHKLKLPHRECPECFGEGVSDVHIPDTRFLSRAARIAYAGVKVTRDGGIEVKVHSRVDATIKVGQHLGMFKEVHDHNHKGAVGVADISGDLTPELRERVAKEMLRVSGYVFDDE
ncbi:hypothetical protein WK59_03855 [Burkholderia ubonensis]|uniref:terminase small subunit n=1 Tax=Burkholderia ubonensis TaxID=101571 RepID=UPI00075F67F7|nr:terminase small subunit [Burkholderia ubonensis]KVD35438.1 hypothetical protein WI84_16340 [Burkholderia ubonensis]KVT91881.1 hypothetical protein WK59_03855 [Burkholderia ubonensis]